jgi:adenylate kinase family enzyme
MDVYRVFITGGPASGKTTLSRRIAVALGAPVYDLDGILLDLTASGERLEANPDDVAGIIARDSWVAEGTYLGWTEPLLLHAELIVWMDISWRKAAYRIVSRHIKSTVAENNRFPGWRRLYRFWRWSGRYYQERNAPGLDEWGVPNTRSTLLRILEPHSNKLLVCRTDRDVESLLAKISG